MPLRVYPGKSSQADTGAPDRNAGAAVGKCAAAAAAAGAAPGRLLRPRK